MKEHLFYKCMDRFLNVFTEMAIKLIFFKYLSQVTCFYLKNLMK